MFPNLFALNKANQVNETFHVNLHVFSNTKIRCAQKM